MENELCVCGHDKVMHVNVDSYFVYGPFTFCQVCSNYGRDCRMLSPVDTSPNAEVAAAAIEAENKQVTQLIRGAIDETRELVAALPEELFTLRKQNRELLAACELAVSVIEKYRDGELRKNYYVVADIDKINAAIANAKGTT